jgi:hypothetical protein
MPLITQGHAAALATLGAQRHYAHCTCGYTSGQYTLRTTALRCALHHLRKIDAGNRNNGAR